jgi:hypothetical protein
VWKEEKQKLNKKEKQKLNHNFSHTPPNESPRQAQTKIEFQQNCCRGIQQSSGSTNNAQTFGLFNHGNKAQSFKGLHCEKNSLAGTEHIVHVRSFSKLKLVFKKYQR